MADRTPSKRGKYLHARGLALLTGLLVGCAKAPAPPKLIHPPPPSALLPEPPGWPYWQAPTVVLRSSVDLDRVFEDEADPAWLKSDEAWGKTYVAILERLRAHGLAVHETGRVETRIGAFYEERARRGASLLITIDGLFAIVHLALASAFAEVEARFERIDLLAMLRRLDVRLSAEVERARPDLLGGYRLARSTIAVALTLADASYGVPPDLADVVALEVARIRAHGGVAESPLFEAPIDYGSMSVRGAISSSDDPGASIFEAAEWLAHAPFLLDGRGEADGAEVSVGTARTHTRAALLLARLLLSDGDAVASAAFTRIDRVDLFALGRADDLSPVDLAQMARVNGLDLRGGGDIVDTAKLDHLRHAASRAPFLFDGSGSVLSAEDGGAATWRPPRSIRLVPLRGTPDARLLERLVFPSVGAPEPVDSPWEALPELRGVPSALDVAAWLGSGTARLLLASRGDTRYAGFDGGLSTPSLPSDELARHASLFGSGLDAISTWLRTPSLGIRESPLLLEAFDRRKLETALVAWTLLRHDALAFGHRRVALAGDTPSSQQALPKGSVPVFIEPHPETIASLLGMIRQTRRGLVDMGALSEGSPSVSLLDETASVLTLGLEGSTWAPGGEASFADVKHDLAELPARLASLERRAGPAAEPVVIDVHLDIGSGRVLEEGTGTIDELFTVVRDPLSQRSVVAVGASIPHFEFVEKAGARRTDASWAAQLRQGRAPSRDSFADADLVGPE